APNVVEDEIDQYLSKQDGKIYRSRDPQLCRHGPLGKCVHCVPLEGEVCCPGEHQLQD
ncbi:NPLOC4 isoform 8, partial [Pan troglodytes]